LKKAEKRQKARREMVDCQSNATEQELEIAVQETQQFLSKHLGKDDMFYVSKLEVDVSGIR
jgi:t-SNARE complex subunit (syntaxin)